MMQGRKCRLNRTPLFVACSQPVDILNWARTNFRILSKF